MYEICGREYVHVQGLKRHEILKNTREGKSKTAEKLKTLFHQLHRSASLKKF